MVAPIPGSRQYQIVLRQVQPLMQASWVPPAIRLQGLQEESQEAHDEHEEADPHQASARVPEEKDKRSVVRMPAATVVV